MISQQIEIQVKFFHSTSGQMVKKTQQPHLQNFQTINLPSLKHKQEL